MHDSACGFKISKSNLGELKEYIDGLDLNIAPNYDVVFEFNEKNKIKSDLFEFIDAHIEVFGKGFEVPYFAFNVEINGVSIREINGGHIKFWKEGIDFIKFSPSNNMLNSLNVGKNIDVELTIVGKLNINEYRGDRLPQVIIQDLVVNKANKKKEITDWNDLF